VRANVTRGARHARASLSAGFRERKLTSKDKKVSNSTTVQEQSLGALSEGNQQKVNIPRILATIPNVLILVEPTRDIERRGAGTLPHLDAHKAGGLPCSSSPPTGRRILAQRATGWSRCTTSPSTAIRAANRARRLMAPAF
jgi:hypothetical protein